LDHAAFAQKIVHSIGVFVQPDTEEHEVSDAYPAVVMVLEGFDEVGRDGLDGGDFFFAGFSVAFSDRGCKSLDFIVFVDEVDEDHGGDPDAVGVAAGCSIQREKTG
jgi:outer membrane scaffolding protein for murein synthesis (MipA/OmpV family)